MQRNRQMIESARIESARNWLNFVHLGGHPEINLSESLKNTGDTEVVLHSEKTYCCIKHELWYPQR